MPYTVDNAPANIQQLPAKKRRQWVAIWNSAWQRLKKAGKSDQDAESGAFAQANGVVLKAEHALFAAWDTAYMNDLPDSAFLFVEDGGKKDSGGRTVPRSNRHFPIRDKDGRLDLPHLRNALARIPQSSAPGLDDAIRDRLTARARRLLAQASHTEENEVFVDPAQVSFADARPAVDADDVVYRTGLLFRAGDYPDKAFSMTAAELAAAADAFAEPVPVDLGHGTLMAHPLEGKLGEVVHLDADGDALYGTVALPAWLNAALGEAPFQVSATWDRVSKQLAGLALVTHPRVPDAALLGAFAAFAKRHDTDQGQRALQELHNTAVRHGAVCTRRGTAEMASSHEHAALQQAHDIATDHGAICDTQGRQLYPHPYYSGFSAPPAPPPAPLAKEGRRMSRLEEFFARLMNDDPAEPPPPTPPPAQLPGDTRVRLGDADVQVLRDEAARLAAENQRLRLERVQERAVAFAEKAKAEHRAFPAETDTLVALYVQAASDDSTLGPVLFGEGRTTTRVELLERQIAARPPNQLTTEQLNPAIQQMFGLRSPATTPTAGEQAITPERRAELLKLHGPLGQSVLADIQKNGQRN